MLWWHIRDRIGPDHAAELPTLADAGHKKPRRSGVLFETEVARAVI